VAGYVPGVNLTGALELLDGKRRVSALSADVRSEPEPEPVRRHWRALRDASCATPPQPGWARPPAPAANALDVPLRAGERTRP
jgi:hypothetical protein